MKRKKQKESAPVGMWVACGAAALVLLIAGYLALFQRPWLAQVWETLLAETSGYPPARTPREAFDRFEQAVKSRDYEHAASFCAGSYAEQLRRAAEPASRLGKGIDGLMEIAGTFGVVPTSRGQEVLRAIDPNTVFQCVVALEQVTDSVDGVAVLTYLDPEGTARQADVRADEAGNWAIEFPAARELAEEAGTMAANHQKYLNAFEEIKQKIRAREILTGEELDYHLQAAVGE